MATTRRLVFVFLVLATSAASVRAQSVTGSVTRSADGVPLAGALVNAYNMRGDTLPAVLTNGVGRFSIGIPKGRQFTLYVRAVGFKPVRVNVGPLPIRGDTVVNITMDRVAVSIAGSPAVAPNECLASETGTSRVSGLWTEVRNSLETSMVTNRAMKRPMDWRTFANDTDIQTGQTLFNIGLGHPAATKRPFQSISARAANQFGYLIGAGRKRHFETPDEAVLLDAAFAETHCFWAGTEDESEGRLVALHFMPITGSRKTEIRGTFWMYAMTYELVNVIFNFTRVTVKSASRKTRSKPVYGSGPILPDSLRIPIASAMQTPGGELRFRRLADGMVILDSWRMWSNDSWPDTNIGGTEPLPPVRILKEMGATVTRVGG